MAAEKNFENKVKRYIEMYGGYQVKYFANAFTKAGVPDLLACVNGKFIGIEVKASTGRPSALQIHNLMEIEEAGGYAILLYPEHYELFQNFIQCIDCGDLENASFNYKLLKGVWMKWTKILEKQ